jgi:peptidoglycan hydrolase CwlO-like protein
MKKITEVQIDPFTKEEKLIDYYVETITETKELRYNIDQLESQITQKQSMINNWTAEVAELQSKLDSLKLIKK